MRYLAVLMFVVVFSGLVGCDGSGGLGLGGGRIEPFGFSNCWYEGGIKDTFAHGKGAVYCLIQGQGKVKQPMTDFCYGEMKPCGSGTYSGREYYRAGGEFRLQYDGEWKDGKYHGQGTLKGMFGGSYVGEFKDGEEHGRGTEYSSRGSVKRKGWWCDGYESNRPCRDKSSAGGGTEHEGKLDQGASVSTGRVTINGDEYVGELKDGKQNGQGTYTWPDGATYVGEFKDGLPNGQGTYTRAEGDKYVGEFKDGLPNGQGILYYPDGSVERKGWFCNDRPSDGPCSN